MPGFRITNIISDKELVDYRYAVLHKDSMTINEWSVKRATLDKFLNDKLFFEDDTFLVILEGVILNSSELINEYDKTTWKDTVCHIIVSDGYDWFKKMEGPVSGAVYYKEDGKWIVFTGHLGEKAIYYWKTGNKVIVASQLGYITDLMREKGADRKANEEALCRLAAYGSYIGSETCIEGINRLYPEEYLIYDGTEFQIISNGLIDVKQDSGRSIKSEKEYIELLDNKFNEAIKRILRKNRDYGYTTIVDLSGGYDSRMNAYAVKALSEPGDSVISICYGQSGCHDEMVAKAIASELGFDYFFMSLDNGSCLYGVDDNVRMLNGATYYCGITGGRDMLRSLSGLNTGLEVTGLLGDVHDGSMVTNYSDGSIDPFHYFESGCLIEGQDFRFPLEENKRFINHVNEHFWFYNRGMICGMGSFFICQNFNEPVTAFGDVSFVRQYLSIPWVMRVKGRLLRKWLASKYPAAAEYTNERTGMKLKNELDNRGALLIKFGKQINKVKRHINKGNSPIGMNDVSFWYETNHDIREFIDEKTDEVLAQIEQLTDLARVMKKLRESDSMMDKENYITINSIFRCFII